MLGRTTINIVAVAVFSVANCNIAIAVNKLTGVGWSWRLRSRKRRKEGGIKNMGTDDKKEVIGRHCPMEE